MKMIRDKKNSTVSVNWNCNKLNKETLSKFSYQLIKNEYSLRQLTISMQECRITDFKLIKQVICQIEKIKELQTFNLLLVCSKIDDYAIIQELIECQNNVKSLHLCMNSINMFNNQVEFISKSLSTFTNLKHLKLQLNGNTIEDRGLQSIMVPISQFEQLETLELDLDNNKLGIESGKFFSKQIVQCKYLRSLNLKVKELFLKEQKILQYIFEDLHYLNNLTELSISISPPANTADHKKNEILTQFFGSISKVQSLRKLDFNAGIEFFNNYVAKQLSQALQDIKMLQTLEVGIFKKKISVINFSKYFEKNEQIKYLKINSYGTLLIQKQVNSLLKAKRLVVLKY